MAQQLVLRRHWRVSWWWVPLSPVAALGLLLVTLLLFLWSHALGMGDASPEAAAAVAGLTLGAAQLLFLRPTPPQPLPWLLSSGLGCLLAAGVLSAAATHLWIEPLAQVLFSAPMAGGAYGSATSIGLWLNAR